MSDADYGRMKQGRFTLSATPGEVLTVQLPSGTRGFRIRPQGSAGDAVLFAVGEDPEAEGSGAFARGNIAITGEPAEVRLPGDSNTQGSGGASELRLRSTVASLPVLIEVY